MWWLHSCSQPFSSSCQQSDLTLLLLANLNITVTLQKMKLCCCLYKKNITFADRKVGPTNILHGSWTKCRTNKRNPLKSLSTKVGGELYSRICRKCEDFVPNRGSFTTESEKGPNCNGARLHFQKKSFTCYLCLKQSKPLLLFGRT